MKKAIILSALLLSQPSWGFSKENYEARITQLEHQVRLLNKQVKRLEAQVINSNDFGNEHRFMYQCSLHIFGDQYTGRSSNRGSAIAEAVNACSEAEDEMFCRPESVKCKQY